MALAKMILKDDEHILVDIANNCGSWSWRKVDKYGMYVGGTSTQFNTKEEAENDALYNCDGKKFL